MTIPITNRVKQSIQKIKKQPSIVLEFEGIPDRFGSATILRLIRIGDAGLVIGNSWVIGGSVAIENQLDAISFDAAVGSTTTKIDYKLNPDLGFGDSITSMQIGLIDDKADTILTLLSNYELLARKCRVLLSPDPTDTTFPEDYITLFRGIVDDVKLASGSISINISHPDQKKRQDVFISGEGELASGMGASQSTIPLGTGEGVNFLVPVNGPDGAVDSSCKLYVRIDDEIIRYTGRSGNTLTGATRGQLGTSAATHSSGASVSSFYRLEGNPVELALKLMLSGWADNYATGVAVNAFRQVTPTLNLSNGILFLSDIFELYGLTVGDYVTISGASEGANNFTLRQITSITRLDSGDTYIEVDGAALVAETDSAATASFRSQFDTLPSGLKMTPDEVDVTEHERLRTLFLSGITYDVYLKDTVKGKEFIAEELYKPIACYSVPRQARASLAYTIGPLPNQLIKTLNADNVKNAGRISQRRSIGRNYYNTVVYKYDEAPLEDRFLKGFLLTDTASRDQIKLDNRTFTIITKGLRDGNVIQSSATRRLDRYKFAATAIDGLRVTFEVGFNLDVADLVIVDGVSLKLPDALTASRTSPSRFYEIISKSIDLQTGDITLNLLDTNFGDAGRYALISPASRVRQGLSQTSFVIESSYAFAGNEFEKWTPFAAPIIRVRSEDYSVAATATISNIAGNTITVTPALGFTPASGYLMELGDYTNATEQIKLLYTHISSATGASFPDGGKTYVMV